VIGSECKRLSLLQSSLRHTICWNMQGRGEGRKVRRRRWQERLHERKAQRRERADQMRAEAKTLIAEKLQAAEVQRASLNVNVMMTHETVFTDTQDMHVWHMPCRRVTLATKFRSPRCRASHSTCCLHGLFCTGYIEACTAT
jgi:hypothetical protein